MIHFLSALRGATADVVARCAVERVRAHPRCPLARYLAGCAEFDRGRPATAVRHWMIAHHASWQLESAAFLVFAGLKLSGAPAPPLLETLAQTWEEYGRPSWGRSRSERALFAVFAEPPPPPVCGDALARGLWLIPLESVRAALRRVSSLPRAQQRVGLAMPLPS